MRRFRAPKGERAYPCVHFGLCEGWSGDVGVRGGFVDSFDQQCPISLNQEEMHML